MMMFVIRYLDMMKNIFMLIKFLGSFFLVKWKIMIERIVNVLSLLMLYLKCIDLFWLCCFNDLV